MGSGNQEKSIAETDQFGVGWTQEEVSAFIRRCFDRDTILHTLLGYAAHWFSHRLILIVGRNSLQGYIGQGFENLDDAALRTVRVRTTPDVRVLMQETAMGPVDELGLAPVFEAEVFREAGVEVDAACSISIRVGGRAAVLLVGTLESDYEPVTRALEALAREVGEQIEALIKRAKAKTLPEPDARIPPLPARFRTGQDASLDASEGHDEDVEPVKRSPEPISRPPGVVVREVSRPTVRVYDMDSEGELISHPEEDQQPPSFSDASDLSSEKEKSRSTQQLELESSATMNAPQLGFVQSSTGEDEVTKQSATTFGFPAELPHGASEASEAAKPASNPNATTFGLPANLPSDVSEQSEAAPEASEASATSFGLPFVDVRPGSEPEEGTDDLTGASRTVMGVNFSAEQLESAVDEAKRRRAEAEKAEKSEEDDAPPRHETDRRAFDVHVAGEESGVRVVSPTQISSDGVDMKRTLVGGLQVGSEAMSNGEASESEAGFGAHESSEQTPAPKTYPPDTHTPRAEPPESDAHEVRPPSEAAVDDDSHAIDLFDFESSDAGSADEDVLDEAALDGGVIEDVMNDALDDAIDFGAFEILTQESQGVALRGLSDAGEASGGEAAVEPDDDEAPQAEAPEDEATDSRRTLEGGIEVFGPMKISKTPEEAENPATPEEAEEPVAPEAAAEAAAEDESDDAPVPKMMILKPARKRRAGDDAKPAAKSQPPAPSVDEPEEAPSDEPDASQDEDPGTKTVHVRSNPFMTIDESSEGDDVPRGVADMSESLPSGTVMGNWVSDDDGDDEEQEGAPIDDAWLDYFGAGDSPSEAAPPEIKTRRPTESGAEEDVDGPQTIPPEALERLLDTGPQIVEIQENFLLMDSRDRESAFQAAEDVAFFGAMALEVLEMMFPGRLFVDRYQYTADTLPDVDEHGPVLYALVRIGDPAMRIALKFLNDSSNEARFYATFLLTKINAAPALDELHERLFDRDKQTRTIARQVLLRYQNAPNFARVPQRLREELGSREELRVEVAASVLAKLRDRESIEVLIDVLGKHPGRVNQAIHQALQHITLHNWSSPYEWRQWWEESRNQPREAWIVEALNAASNATRYLAFEEIQRIPGLELNYHPEQPPKLRRRAQQELETWFSTRSSS